jgi:hypothetical protein
MPQVCRVGDKANCPSDAHGKAKPYGRGAGMPLAGAQGKDVSESRAEL